MSKLNMLKMQHQKEVYTFSDKRIAILCASAISDNGLYRFYNEIVQRVRFEIKFYTSITMFKYLIRTQIFISIFYILLLQQIV